MARDEVASMRSRAAATRSAITVTKPTSAVASSAKVKVSERLEEDAQAMEERLVQLRLKMLEDKQRLERERPAKFGGSRWRSAQEGIGTVSRYAKDVEAKMKQPKKAQQKASSSADAAPASEANGKKKKTKKVRADSAPAVLSAVTVAKWTCPQVLEWLSSLGLEEFCSTFEFHHVTGTTLLTMSMDELIGIGVTRLSSRNLIWTELDKMKQIAQAAAPHEPSEIIDPKLRDTPLVPEMTASLLTQDGSEGTAKVHWSHITPLKELSAAINGSDAVPVNLADGDFDEEASHASFMKALLEWRGGVDDEKDAKDDDMWHNPIEDNSGVEDEQRESRGRLWDGEYDEAKEHAAFAQAVEAWRKAGVQREPAASRPSTAERIEQGSEMAARKGCWQCYRVVLLDQLVVDDMTHKTFCSVKCQGAFTSEHARLYQHLAS
ncbi:hypothetical protein PINS_up014643 [Pythium insidiosum]|nr:hypothetical protein PINS_up014643 [Pythium insidiosum]